MLRLLAPAKLNLYLRVVGRRHDGYHEIETLFERVDLADEITLTLRPKGIVVSCDDPTLDCGPENLVTKAAVLLQRTYGITQGAAIHIAKRIPIASGLGGGSSDAATVLLGLNQLWNIGCSTQQLAGLARQLGSDAPFFITESPFAIGRGRGDLCEPLMDKTPTLWHVLVVPPERLSTQTIYQGFDERKAPNSTLTGVWPSITMTLHALCNGSLGELAKGLYNELEPEAIRRCPILTEIQSRLHEGGCVGVLTSGSGPAVFGLCHDAAHAKAVAHQLREGSPAELRVYVVSTFR